MGTGSPPPVWANLMAEMMVDDYPTQFGLLDRADGV